MSTKKTIRLIMATEYPLDESKIRGGIESVAYHTSIALSKYPGIELHIVSLNDKIQKSHTEKRGEMIIHWVKPGWTVKGLQTLTFLLLDIVKLKKVYRRINADIIHVQNLSGYALPCNKKDKVVITLHGVEAATSWARTNSFYQGFIGLFRLLSEQYIYKQSLKKADCVITNSGSYAIDCLKKYLSNKYIEYVDHPLSKDFFPEWTKSPDTNRTILCVAGMIERKRIIGLVEAFNIVRKKIKVTLILMGPLIEKAYYNKVLKTIKKLKLENNVIIEQKMTQQKLIDAYKRCSVFVLPSGQETAPMAIAAAMAIGRPVISTNVGGVPTMVKDNVSGYLYSPGDVGFLSKRLIQLLSDDNKLDEIGKQNRKIAEERFTTNIVAEKLGNIYQKILNK